MSGVKRTRATLIQAAATLLAAVIAAAATLVAASKGAIPPEILSLPTQTATATATAKATATVTETVTAMVTSSRSERTDRVFYVSDLSAISALNDGSRTLGGKTYTHSLFNELGGCNERAPGEYVVPTETSAFIADIGVEIDAAEELSRVTFIVSSQGEELPNQTLGVGESQTVELGVTPNTRIKLEAVIDENRRDNCNTEAVAVWGGARFR